MRGYVNPDLDIDMRAFNVMKSPVPCSSDVWISPSQSNIIKKTKMPGKRPQNGVKMVWEFLQYRILHELFKEYGERLRDQFRIEVPSAVGVQPRDWTIYTEFAPGFILSLFDEHAKDVSEVKHLNEITSPLESSIAIHLGIISRIKELEGIYHHDYSLSHLIFDPNTPTLNMFDLENTRYLNDKELVAAESRKVYGRWLRIARNRGADLRKLGCCYEFGRDIVPKKASVGYVEMARKVGEEFDVNIQITKGIVDGYDLSLAHPKVKD